VKDSEYKKMKSGEEVLEGWGVNSKRIGRSEKQRGRSEE
jgi:hypothetical protein